MEAPVAPSRIQRIMHELRRRTLRVIRVAPLGRGFVAVTFGGDALEGFISASFDDHVKLFLRDAEGREIRRDYTPCYYDAQRRELTIEFGLHGNGPGAAWARHAAPGQIVEIGGPRGSLVVPAGYPWHLLAGDASALPAIRRRLSELPAGTRAIVLVQLAHPEDCPPLESSASLHCQIVPDAQAWVAHLRDLVLPAGEGFCWCAGEASMMADARSILREEKGVGKHAMRITAYWRKGEADFHENLEMPPV